MTVNELIEQLKNYPGDMRVLTLGYEGGYNDIDLKTNNIVFNYNDKDTWYYGPHESKTYAYIEHDSVDMVESHVDDLNTLSGHKYNKFVQDEKCLIITRGK
jgi:hypothetical protein